MSSVIVCPSCEKPVAREGEFQPTSFPFCSKRCQMVDLGKWFQGEYVIPGPIGPDDEEAIAAIIEARQGEV